MNASFESKKQHKEHRTSMADSSSAIAYPSRTIVHAKLEMTSPGDLDEQEADAVANEVVSGGKIARKISGGGGSSGIAVSRQMESRLLQQQGGGQPMPSGLRSKMESSFGKDLSQVRLHTDSDAISMSSSIHARAFTFGNDIYFNNGQFSPETSAGQHLVAHELTHAMQGTGKIGRREKHNESVLYSDPNSPNGGRLTNAKALAKLMVSNSIRALELMKEGKYIGLFYYCFGNSGTNEQVIQNINTVQTNFKAILGVLSDSNNKFIDPRTGRESVLKFEFQDSSTFDDPTHYGSTYNYWDVDAENSSHNTIFLNKQKFFSVPMDNWSDQLLFASTIIHELSHRVCGTDDFSYFLKNDNRSTINYHDDQGNTHEMNRTNNMSFASSQYIKNAASYEIFATWVESTIFSVFDEGAESTDAENTEWNWDNYRSSYLYNGNPSVD